MSTCQDRLTQRFLYWLSYENAVCCCTSSRFDVSKFSVTGLTTLFANDSIRELMSNREICTSLWTNIIHRRSNFQLLRFNNDVYPLNHPIDSIVMESTYLDDMNVNVTSFDSCLRSLGGRVVSAFPWITALKQLFQQILEHFWSL